MIYAEIMRELLHFPRDGDGMPRFKDYLEDKKGVPVRTIWDDVYEVNSVSHRTIEDTTLKNPNRLLERIIKHHQTKTILLRLLLWFRHDLAVAEKLGRKWIGCDLGKFAIHTTRKRMIGVQRQMKADGKDFRAFEILNLGKYERAHYIGVNIDLREEEKQQAACAEGKRFYRP